MPTLVKLPLHPGTPLHMYAHAPTADSMQLAGASHAIKPTQPSPGHCEPPPSPLARFRHIAACDNPIYSTFGRLFGAALQGDRERVLDGLSTPGVQHLMRKYGTTCAPVASCLAHVGENALALDWLEEAVELGYTNHRFIGEHDRLLTSLRDEPRFQALLERARVKEQALIV